MEALVLWQYGNLKTAKLYNLPLRSSFGLL